MQVLACIWGSVPASQLHACRGTLLCYITMVFFRCCTAKTTQTLQERSVTSGGVCLLYELHTAHRHHGMSSTAANQLPNASAAVSRVRY
jgi:hypothetical protein